MDTTPPFTISPMLREAAELKVDELIQTKEEFKLRYHLDARQLAGTDTVGRVKFLLENISALNPELVEEDYLETIGRYVDQAKDDRSLSESKMLKFEGQIRNKLGQYLNRLEVSSLHVELMKEAMDAEDAATSVATKLGNVDLDDDFEVVENELDEVLEKFEKETFTADEIAVEPIEAYLSGLFADMRDKEELEAIRHDLQVLADDMVTEGGEVDQDFMMWCIMDLLKSDLVGKDKKKTLEGYLQSPIALRELVATINMKSVSQWKYKNSDKGLPVSAKRNSEGQYCIAVEESIVDLLFLHCVGTGWAMKLKYTLVQFARGCNSFSTGGLSIDESNKREFFLGRKPTQPIAPACTVCHPLYPPAPMPPPPPAPMEFCPPPPPVVVIDRLNKKKSRNFRSWASIPPLPASGNLASRRNGNYRRDFFMSRLPILEGCTPKMTPLEEVQANMMKTLAAESKLREAFDGHLYAGSVKLESLASSLPHKTVLTVLKFLGIPETMLEFFERFLSTKLNIGPAVRGAPDRVLPRARGVQEGHALELFFTEAVMFFLELAVNQKTGSYMYRLKDRCYFVGNVEQHEAFEAQVAEFAVTLGLEVSFEQTTSIGFLTIDAQNTVIEEAKIATYARHIKKQLSACTTVLDWVRVWNNTAGTYAAHLFGPLANVFGRTHLDDVRNAYKLIFDIILEGGDLTLHVKQLLIAHLKRPLSDLAFAVEEALIYLPQAYGGLGVKNPFITLNLAHELREDPDAEITKYLDTEETYYQRAAENYALLPADAYARKLEVIYENNDDRVIASLGASRDLTVFMTKEELTAHRESAPYPSLPFPPPPATYKRTTIPALTTLYDHFLHEPSNDIPSTEKILDDIRRLSGKGDMKYWSRLSGEDKWVLQLYGDECFERYGGLEIWVGECVPQEVLKAVRGASWDEADDESSYLTEY